ncbi:30S ribosomal protein S14 [Nitrospira defluvii]|uniref:Small ribosomal subunit protein uS14 n=1 Tax=Nitrospira defluvii TaxID=330214 RepID=A0ABN7MIN2_9BACT|nr:30S ribosomal protein S14 [Nitrospira defluvii]CAE6800841.1 30S ribosomal protein S14 [Nitrospira defluvii]
MAKLSSQLRNEKRKQLVTKYAEQRRTLKAVVRNQAASLEEKQEAQSRLNSLPRNASPVRVRNRCGISGRVRGYLRRFGMSRIDFRLLALKGEIPGVRKSSW